MRGGAEWSGFLYDGRTADRQPVTLTLEPAGIRVRKSDDSSSLWPIGELRQTQGSFSSELLRLEYGVDPVQALFVDQPGFGAALRREYPRANPSFRGQRRTVRIIAWGMGTVAAVVALYLLGANAAADWVARRTPPSWETALGRGVAEDMAPPSRQCGDSASRAAVRSVLDRLLATAPRTPYDFRLVVVRDSSINAFAAPGGFIAVHSGFISAARTPEELAGVLAHEVQHVTHRHSVRAIVREAPVRIALSIVFGGTEVEGLASMVGSLGVLRYRRGDESEADRDGMHMMQAAGIDGRAMVTFMQTLSQKNADMPRLIQYLSSHPHTANRVAELERLAAEGRGPTTPILDDATWARVKQMCDAPGPGAM